MAEPVGDRVHAHVGEHPLGRDAVRDAQRVVKAVAAGALAEGLPDAERHEVADDRERRGRHLEELRQSDPQRGVAGAGRAGEIPRRAPARELGVETAADRALVPVHHRTRRASRADRGRRAAPPTDPARGSGRCPSAPTTIRISVVADARDHAGLGDLMTAHDLGDVELERRRRAGERQVLRGRPDARSSGELLHHLDARAEPAAAEQRARPRSEGAHHLHPPPGRRARHPVQPEERACVHQLVTAGARSARRGRRAASASCR